MGLSQLLQFYYQLQKCFATAFFQDRFPASHANLHPWDVLVVSHSITNRDQSSFKLANLQASTEINWHLSGKSNGLAIL